MPRNDNPRALEGRTAIVTGASSGIGRAAALRFARAGANLVLGARREAELDALASLIERNGGAATVVPGDVRDASFAQRLVDTALQRFGALHVGFNNAGGTGTMAPAGELRPDDWHDTIAVNLTGAFLCARHQLPPMLAAGAGSLVFTSTFVGHTVGMPGMAAYAAAKAGVIGMVQVLAAEAGPHGVRVNALLPGGTDTPGASGFTSSADGRAFVERLHALKRIARPDEIADAALFLASDASSFVTGSALRVDGGVSIMRT